MKRIFFSLTLLVMVSSITSCKKFLNTEPIAFAAPAANYATQPQLLQALAGVYDVLGYNRSGLYADNLFDKLGATTDEGFYARATVNALTESYTFDYTEPTIDETWKALYIGIERANNLIYYINTPVSMDPLERTAILGEAEFMRGYYYFLLVSFFGDVPMRLEPTTITGAATNNVPRTPSKDVYTQILKDMTDAEAKCYPASKFGYSSRVSQTTVQGILARVCLTMAGYPLLDKTKYKDALQWATKVQQSGIHALNPSYSQIFINEAQDVYDIKEAMWEADFNGNDLTGTLETGRLGNTNGITFTNANFADTGYCYGFINVTKKLYNLYGAGDLRRDWAIAPYGYSGTGARTNKGTLIYDRNCGKWRRSYELLTPKSKNNTGINFPILRYADVLLMLAEADNKANNGPSVAAYNAINQVRRRGYGYPVNLTNVISDLTPGMSVTQFQDAIQDERARELCFETQRRPDLIRWGIWTQTMSVLANQISTDLGTNTLIYAAIPAANAASSPKFLLYPIPASEISVNKSVTQNPGY